MVPAAPTPRPTVRINRAWLRSNFPCRAACPVGTNAGGYVSLIAQDRLREAYALARRPNPLASICGRICAHPCEAACRRGALDEPISIRALKRFLTERFGPESQRSFLEILEVVERPRPPVDQGRRVAVVGAGPAGLACAHDLALMGHEVVVLDAAPVAGGMLRLGVPSYRLPREVLQAEVDFIAFLGVEFRLGIEVGRDLSFASLVEQYDAVFLAPGCRRGKTLPLPGVTLTGVLTALEFLAKVNLGLPTPVGDRVVVVGGGNVAFDVARSARRFGGTTLPSEEHHNLLRDAATVAARILKRQVTVVALESREELPSSPEEIEQGADEGIRLITRRGPKEILGRDGRVTGLRTLAVERVFDPAGRFAPLFAPGTETDIACDTVILAIGQVADLDLLGEGHGIATTRQGTIAVDPATLATSRPGVYAGGDVAFGPRIAIEAVADGRRAARAIDTYLTGRADPAGAPAEGDLVLRAFPSSGYHHPFADGDYETIHRGKVPVLERGERGTFRAVELGYDADEARREGSRCLHCWINTVFDSDEAAGSSCIQCGGCADVCPVDCIDLVSVRRLAPGPALVASDRLPALPGALAGGAALVKDETRCIRCGLCARRCPAGTIRMVAHYRADEQRWLRHADAVL